MARRYARDNSGRFSSTGATARGGRLATASGKKRATQTSKLTKRATPSGAIRKTDVITARVQNAISKNVQQKNPKAGEGPAARVARAERRISARQSRPGTTAPKPAAKLPREARLQRAADTATRIAKARREKADTAAATFADRRRISSRVSSEGRSAAFAKENVAGKQSAQALRSSLRADARVSNLRQTMGAAATAKPAASKPAAKPATRKVDLSASAFSRRAEVAEVRANFAGSAVRSLDRANPSNRKAFAKADALQAASDRYSSIVRKSRGGEFTAAQVFQGMNTKRSTVPTRSEKAAKTRADKKLKALEVNIKAAERARRMG
jgi:hypothetical protein